MKREWKPGPVEIEGRRYGAISRRGDGFIFIPWVAGRSSSRKIHSTPAACVPAWVRRAARAADRKADEARVRVAITRAEAEWAGWAIDAMRDVLADPDGCREMYGRELEEGELPELRGSTLTLPREIDPAVLDDLRYRLLEQAPDVAETDAVSEAQVANRAATPRRLFEKIAAAIRPRTD